MIESHDMPRCGRDGRDITSLETVAEHAGTSQVFADRGTTVFFADDMLNLKVESRIPFPAPDNIRKFHWHAA